MYKKCVSGYKKHFNQVVIFFLVCRRGAYSLFCFENVGALIGTGALKGTNTVCCLHKSIARFL